MAEDVPVTDYSITCELDDRRERGAKRGVAGLLVRVLPRGRFGRSVVVLAAGTATAQAILLLAAPVITRLFTPADFGTLAVYTSLLTTLLAMVAMRYELAIPLPPDDETAANLLAVALSIIVVIAGGVGMLVWLKGAAVVKWTKAPALGPYLWLLPFALAIAGANLAFTYLAIRRSSFPTIARSRLAQSVGQVSTQIGTGLIQLGPAGLLIGDLVGRLGGASSFTAFALGRDTRKALLGISIPGMKRAAHRYVRFPLFSGASGVLNAAGTNVPTLLFAAFFGAQPVGWFALAQRVVAAPMALVGQSVAQVYFSTGAKLASEPRALRSLFLRTAWHMLVIGALPCTILILAGRWLFPFVFGSQWVVTGQYVQIMAVMFLLQFVTNPISSTLDILERQDLELAWNIGRFVLVVGALAGAGHAGWSPLRSIMAYSVAMSFAYLSLFLLLAYAISRRRIAPTSQLREA